MLIIRPLIEAHRRFDLALLVQNDSDVEVGLGKLLREQLLHLLVLVLSR